MKTILYIYFLEISISVCTKGVLVQSSGKSFERQVVDFNFKVLLNIFWIIVKLCLIYYII